MAIDKVKAYFAEFGREGDVMEFPASSATVELAAQAVGCEPARIAKTLSFAVGDRVALVVCAGDARIANPKFKAQFGCKPRMLPAEEAEERIGHAVGGVCPFAVNEGCGRVLGRIAAPLWRGVPGLRQLQQRHCPHPRRAGCVHSR
ncbi:YbaK/EbsC family protein [Adlercreutzia equolifaciens]|uniref:YbaK/EbsC family protein n=1 Tax=Adlercreutzia equolifaciens TaxID=446660 RepID=UPI00267140CF|nr:YbaK/EbsC family protein [Adlercreutzia equolifaciens]